MEFGFEQQYDHKIFEIFQRLHSRRMYEGTGMGLALCKKIVQKHDGNIWATSELGRGSIFYVRLPCDLSLPINGQSEGSTISTF